MIANKKALLLDMNNTFMFGEDRFGENEDFSTYYESIGGTLPANQLRSIIMDAYHYLDVRYPNEQFRHSFPSVETAILETYKNTLSADEMNRILDTFAFHELGTISPEYIDVLFKLENHFPFCCYRYLVQKEILVRNFSSCRYYDFIFRGFFFL